MAWIYILMTTIWQKRFEREEHVFIRTIFIPPILFYTTLILRIATGIILLRSPNFTDYWDYTNPLCLIDPYDNYARHNTYINILNGYDQWKCDQRSRNFVFSKVININPIQDGLFWGCSQIRRGGGGGRPPALKSVTHILQ